MPAAKRLDTSPAGLGNDSDLPTAAARAAELVNGSHLASTLSTVQGARVLPTLPQASRVAPISPASRPAPSTPVSAELTPLPADLRLRTIHHHSTSGFTPATNQESPDPKPTKAAAGNGGGNVALLPC